MKKIPVVHHSNGDKSALATTNPLLFLCLGVMLAVLFTACQAKDDFSNFEAPSFEPEYAFPILNTSLSIKDLLGSIGTSFLVIEADGKMKLLYSGSDVEKKATEIINFPEKIDFQLPTPSLKLPLPSVGGVLIKSTTLKAGTLRYTFATTTTTTVTLNIPSLSNANGAFKQDYTANAGNTPEITLNLAGYTLSPSANQEIEINYTVQNGNTSSISDFKGSFEKLEYNYLEGYMTEQVYDFPKQRTYLALFNDAGLGGVADFLTPKVIISAQNSFGFPMEASFSTLDALSLSDSKIQTIPITHPSVPIQFEAAKTKTEVKTTNYALDVTNSNMRDILNQSPVAIEYDVDLKSKADANSLMFLTDESKIKFRADFELPMYLKAYGFGYNQSFETDLSSFEGAKNVEMKIITENRIPGTISMQIYFKDNKGKTVDSLFDGAKKFLDGAPVDADGNVNGTNKQEIFALLDAKRIERIKNTKKIIIKMDLATTGNGKEAVKLHGNQTMTVRIGAKFK